MKTSTKLVLFNYALTLAAIALMMLLLAAKLPAQAGGTVDPSSDAVVQRVLNGATVATASGVITNIGQSQHICYVEIPTAVGATSVTVRFEFSTNGVDWQPIGNQIDTIPLLMDSDGNNYVYGFIRAFGSWPALRVNMTTNVPGALPLNAVYVGNQRPSVPILAEESDRWVF